MIRYSLPPPLTMDAEVSVAVQTAFINSQLNCTLMVTLCMGVYTVVFVGTIYLYAHRQTEQNPIVIAVVSTLFAITCAYFILLWIITKQEFIDNGETRLSIYNFITTGDIGATIATYVLPTLGFVLADGLLIWRCFHMVRGSIRWMCIPLLLFTLEIGVSVTSTVATCIAGADGDYVTVVLADVVNATIAGVYALSAATSLSATFIICRKMVTSMENIQDGSNSKARYKNILQILVQSALIYTGISLVSAVLSVTICFVTTPQVYQASQYATNVYVMATGILPTLMVAHIMFTRSQPAIEVQGSDLGGLSTLRFNHHPIVNATQCTGNELCRDEPLTEDMEK